MINNPYRAYWEKAQAESLKLAQYYTPECLVDLCIELLQPKGELFDPCCGLGSFLLKAKTRDESLNISGNDIATDLGELPFAFTLGDYLKIENQKHDYIIANIPFNLKKTHCDLVDENYCWIEKIITNTSKKALIILPSGVNSGLNKRLLEKRKQIIASGYLELVCQLPSHLFNQTGIAPVLWLIDKTKTSKDIYFLHAERFSIWQNKKRFLTEKNIEDICDKNNWIKASLERIKEKDYFLMPGLYDETDTEPKLSKEEIEQEIRKLAKELRKDYKVILAEWSNVKDLLDKLEKNHNFFDSEKKEAC